MRERDLTNGSIVKPQRHRVGIGVNGKYLLDFVTEFLHLFALL